MSEQLKTDLHRALVFIGQIIIAGMVAIYGGRSTTAASDAAKASATAATVSADSQITLDSIDRKLGAISARVSVVENFVKQNSEPGQSASPSASPNENPRRKGGGK